jgi:hypothetical protein
MIKLYNIFTTTFLQYLDKVTCFFVVTMPNMILCGDKRSVKKGVLEKISLDA